MFSYNARQNTIFLFLTLNSNLEVAKFRVPWWICSSVDHGMASLRKHVWWCHLGGHSNTSLIIICSCNWSPGHCGWGFPFVRENTLCRWTGFAKWRCFIVFKQNNNTGFSCMLLDLQPLTYIVRQQSASQLDSQLVINSATRSLGHSVTRSPSHPATQSLSHSVPQLLSYSVLSHPVTQSPGHPVTQSLRQWVSQEGK